MCGKPANWDEEFRWASWGSTTKPAGLERLVAGAMDMDMDMDSRHSRHPQYSTAQHRADRVDDRACFYGGE